MSDKLTAIKKMIEMQKKFIAYEQENGVDPVDYWMSKDGHPLHNYRDEYQDLARKVVDLAHSDKGSQA
ncbi:MAG: hypothetical protein V3V12_01005 [Gammaproteobacteria bacterium]